MEKKRLIRTLLTVLPIILVPLIVERKRIKDHPDAVSYTHLTLPTTPYV